MTEAEVRPRWFDVPGSRTCIEAMQSWLEGEPVPSYDRIIETWGISFEDVRKQWARVFDGGKGYTYDPNLHAAIYEARNEYVARYGFLIPCAELLDALAAHAPIVEVGAGSGCMTRLMRLRGIDVIGSDIDEHGSNSGHGFVIAEHDDEQVRSEAKTMVRRHPERTVFCSWPTYRETWFRQALRAMRVGQKIIVTREECLAEPSAWAYLDNCFEELQVIELPVFPYIHDYAGVYVKRRQDAQTKTRTALLGRRGALARRRASRNPRPAQKAA